MVQLSYLYMNTGKTIALTIWTLVHKVMSLLFNMLSSIVIVFLPRIRFFLFVCFVLFCFVFKFHGCNLHQRWFWSSGKENLSLFPLFPLLFVMRWWDQMPRSSFFECYVLSQLFISPLSPSSRGSSIPLHFLLLEWYSLHIWGCWYFFQWSWFKLVIHPAQHFT